VQALRSIDSPSVPFYLRFRVEWFRLAGFRPSRERIVVLFVFVDGAYAGDGHPPCALHLHRIRGNFAEFSVELRRCEGLAGGGAKYL